MKIKVSQATSLKLDWLVGTIEKVEGLTDSERTKKCYGYDERKLIVRYSPTTSWAQGGEIIDREKISIVWAHFHWCAGTGDIGEIYRSDEGNHFTGTGPTALVAAMHCYVASKLGEEVEVLDELA